MNERVKTYIKVAPFQHVMSLSSSAFAAGAAILSVDAFAKHDAESALIPIVIGLFELAVVPLMQMEAVGQLRRYNKMKRLFIEKGWDETIVRQNSHWWCHRHASQMAARDSGHAVEMGTYLSDNGYRWHQIYH